MFVSVTENLPRSCCAHPVKSALMPPWKKTCTKCEGSTAAAASPTNGPTRRAPAAAAPIPSAPLINPRRDRFFMVFSERQEVAGGKDRRAGIGPALGDIGLVGE